MMKLDRREAAIETYRLHVDKLLARDDRLAAASTSREKMQLKDEAVQVLRLAWPESRQAMLCIKELLNIHIHDGQHQDSANLLDEMETTCPTPMKTAVLEMMADVAKSYPAEQLRHHAAKRVVVKASEWTREKSSVHDRSLLLQVARLHPEDRALSRDCRRLNRQPPPAPLIVPPVGTLKTLKPVQSVQLLDCQLRDACRIGQAMYAIGNRIVSRGAPWRVFRIGNSTGFDVANLSSSSSETIAATPQVSGFVFNADVLRVFIPGSTTVLIDQTLFSPDKYCPNSTRLNGGGILNSQTLGFALDQRSGEMFILRLSDDGQLTMTVFDRSLKIMANEQVAKVNTLAIDPEWSVTLPLQMVHHNRKVYFAADRHVYGFEPGQILDSIYIERTVGSLFCSPGNTRSRLAVTYRDEPGGKLIWLGNRGTPDQGFAHDMANIVGVINRGGFLVAANRHRAEIYSTNDGKLRQIAEINKMDSVPVKILAGQSPFEFVICFANGQISWYNING